MDVRNHNEGEEDSLMHQSTDKLISCARRYTLRDPTPDKQLAMTMTLYTLPSLSVLSVNQKHNPNFDH